MTAIPTGDVLQGTTEPLYSPTMGYIPRRICERHPNMWRLKAIPCVDRTITEGGKAVTKQRMTQAWKTFEREVMGWICADRSGEKEADFNDLATREEAKAQIEQVTEQTKTPF